MRVVIEQDFPGIEDRVVRWSANERKTLQRAAALLAEAREAAGPDTEIGSDLGKGEVVLRDYLDGVVISTELGPVTL